ncbi:hypothetical protein BD309DRAFT_473621 [Dichomitus squalens]|nr:hypothetical protein BD309DRAFT_473621 [Dichomitus squalens]
MIWGSYLPCPVFHLALICPSRTRIGQNIHVQHSGASEVACLRPPIRPAPFPSESSLFTPSAERLAVRHQLHYPGGELEWMLPDGYEVSLHKYCTAADSNRLSSEELHRARPSKRRISGQHRVCFGHRSVKHSHHGCGRRAVSSGVWLPTNTS